MQTRPSVADPTGARRDLARPTIRALRDTGRTPARDPTSRSGTSGKRSAASGPVRAVTRPATRTTTADRSSRRQPQRTRPPSAIASLRRCNVTNRSESSCSHLGLRLRLGRGSSPSLSPGRRLACPLGVAIWVRGLAGLAVGARLARIRAPRAAAARSPDHARRRRPRRPLHGQLATYFAGLEECPSRSRR